MTIEKSPVTIARTELRANLLNPDSFSPQERPKAKRSHQSFPVIKPTVVAFLDAGQSRNLDARFTSAAVDAAVFVVAAVAHELHAKGEGYAFDGTDAYGDAARGIGLGLLHLRRAQMELALVRTSDRTLVEAIHQLEEALCGVANLINVRPEADRLAEHAAKPATVGTIDNGPSVDLQRANEATREWETVDPRAIDVGETVRVVVHDTGKVLTSGIFKGVDGTRVAIDPLPTEQPAVVVDDKEPTP